MLRKAQKQHREPDDWTLCLECRAVVYVPRYRRNLRVCPECGRHGQVAAPERIEQLCDPESVRPLSFSRTADDPLGFVDSRPYRVRLDDARRDTGLDDAVLCARGAIEGREAILAVMDFRFMGGSLGAAAGELVTRAAETALRERIPLIIVTASGGARMQEGAISLMQMAKTSQALARLDEAGVLTVSVITDPTFGGVAASFATLCDVIVAESGARLGFAGPRVIEQTIGRSLPEGFQSAEFLLAHGMVDAVRPRGTLRPMLGRLLRLGVQHGAETPGEVGPGGDVLVTDPEGLAERDAWEVVRQARHLGRPTALDYLREALDEFEELRGDRIGADCPAIVGGLGRLGDLAVVAIGQQKGHDLAELAARNFGMPTPAGYRKAARLMRLAAKLGLPVVTLVDTPGAYPGAEAEEQGQAVAIAENLRLMAALPVPIVAVVIGEGGSGGALALTVADRVLIYSNAFYSVISPEGCAAILWKDAAAAPAAAAALRLDARHLLRLGVVDGVLVEPERGAEHDHAGAARRLRAVLSAELRALRPLSRDRLVSRRRERFRRFGANGGDSDANDLDANDSAENGSLASPRLGGVR
ncbi:acetyl-CoA carboxylase carboxyl transferase subunit alpha [Actinomadura chokoriensis]